MMEGFIVYITIFLFGIVIGSFLNVCIYRIPRKEGIVIERSHCMNCNYKLEWYDLIPLLSFIALRGKCRKCKTKLSWQYPIVEAMNGILWCLVFVFCGFSVSSICYCLMTSVLIVISVIDWRTYEIPIGCNICIFIIGCVHLIMNRYEWQQYVIGFFIISGLLLLIFLATKGRGIGGGDIKLMAVCGLVVGWKMIVLAFFVGCVLGAVLHIIRMKISKADNVLSFGPYLSAGVIIAVLWGEQILKWYLGFF